MATRQAREKRLRHRKRAHRVHGEGVGPAVEIHVVGALALGAVSAGIVNENIDRLTREVFGERFGRREIGHVERMNVDVVI